MPRRMSLDLAFAALMVAGAGWSLVTPALAQSAADAANELAILLDNVTQLSSDNLVSALQDAAEAGEPLAMWQLGLMYESGTGVERDEARAFQYFSQIADEHADAPPRGLDADIVAQSFVKIGDYYRHGVPDAGIPVDNARARALVMHAASYFGDADAQFRVGELYLDPNELGVNPIQSARWLSLAAGKGHPGAQARLGELLYRGEGIEPQPVEGLMWIMLAQRNARGTVHEAWIAQLVQKVQTTADPGQLEAAMMAAETYAPQFSGY